MALYQEAIFIDDANNKWVSDSVNNFSTAYNNLYTQVYYNQIYGMSLDVYVNQNWSLLFPDITRYWTQVWGDWIVSYVTQVWGDAQTIQKIVHQYWWSAPQPTRYWKQDWGMMVKAVKTVHQVWSLLQEVKAYVHQDYSMTDTIVTGYINQLWDLNEYEFVQRAFHQIWSMIAGTSFNPSSDSYTTNSTSGTYDSVNYPVALTNNDSITETWTITFTSATTFTVSGSQVGSVGSGNTTTNLAPTNPSTGDPYFTLDYNGWGGTWATDEIFTFKTYRGSTGVTYSVTIDGQLVFSPTISIELDEDRATIDARLEIVNPNYFGLCVQNNPVVITVGNTDYHLIIRGISVSSGTHVDKYQLQCQSPIAILNANTTPLLQKEYPAGMASDIMQELADIAGLTVDWQVYHNGYLVDWLIPASTLFANNEKPLAVMRKITEACGAAIQSKPDGNIEILHEFPTRVPDWDTAAPAYILNNLVSFESMSASDEEKLGINTVYVSDQSTADKSYDLEEEEISSTKKRVLGFHTPWDSTEVELTTSGGSSVSIVYKGVETAVEPPYIDKEGEAVDPELVEIVDGAGSVSKPFYGLVYQDYQEDSLGALTFSEDGSFTTETNGESLINLRYYTKYHVWEVTSPTIRDVQCILRLVDYDG